MIRQCRPIVALNGLDSADAMIRDGQELIIAVPEPDLQLRVTKGEVYEEDYMEEPIIIDNDSWYTTKEVVQQEGTTGHRERNDVVVYENGVETSREMIHQNVMVASQAAVIERGTIIPPDLYQTDFRRKIYVRIRQTLGTYAQGR